jgi:hypothetical protein
MEQLSNRWRKQRRESIFVCTRKPGGVQGKVVANKILSNRHFSRIRGGQKRPRIERRKGAIFKASIGRWWKPRRRCSDQPRGAL